MSTVLKRKFQTIAFSTTILNILLTELDVKDTLFDMYEGLVVLDFKCDNVNW